MHNLCSDRLKNYFVDYYDYPSRKNMPFILLRTNVNVKKHSF
ncbi:hypothetical protein HMPREF1565_3621 [Providencia alcalifaciens RIMD 1656011]|uniref:Uncharacterized protein n=1 Tax=Providencia alcalifaciens DSM 30120 TaxID=520999 RepID=B6XAM9_9GAMM|nr:hypothetical protein PROVALCAL_00377 [Providencia alcalifaciens DSM 30120]EUD03515.1 hypothetical protein HMPREF1565_3621 [Providencia alcalifaciens RIMD 1656011]